MNQALFDAVAPHVVPVVIVFSRLTGLFILAPILGGSSVPARVKVLLAVALTLIVYPTVPIDPATLPMTPDLAALAPLMASELLVGLSVGALASLPLLAAQAGGHMISQQMALAIASVFDPATDTDGDLIGQALTFLLLTIFLAMGGLELMIGAVVRTFELVPLGAFGFGEVPLDLFVALMGAAFEVAIRVAAPVVCVIFVETLATGMIMKTVPQLNILSFGFPLKILAGLAMLAGSVIFIDTAMDGFVERSLTAIGSWVESLGEEAAHAR
jgi:flagellar biosynthetic protein FliR